MAVFDPSAVHARTTELTSDRSLYLNNSERLQNLHPLQELGLPYTASPLAARAGLLRSSSGGNLDALAERMQEFSADTSESSRMTRRYLDQRLRLSMLRAVDAVEAHRSLLTASAALGITQPALTKSLQELEDIVQTRLFDRHSRGVRPTDAGARVCSNRPPNPRRGAPAR